MADPTILSLTCLLLAVALVGALWSRHRLSVRHRAMKVTLNRVAGERDVMLWERRMEEKFDG